VSSLTNSSRPLMYRDSTRRSRPLALSVQGVLLAVAYWLEVSFEMPRLDFTYLGAGVAILWLLSSLAVFAPARRASMVPPAVATRSV